jgi:hypothetical protein
MINNATRELVYILESPNDPKFGGLTVELLPPNYYGDSFVDKESALVRLPDNGPIVRVPWRRIARFKSGAGLYRNFWGFRK